MYTYRFKEILEENSATDLTPKKVYFIWLGRRKNMLDGQVNLKQQKLALEKSAFSDSKEDISDVTFEIGKSSYTAGIFGFIVLSAAFFGARIVLSPYFVSTGTALSIGDIIFWCFIVLMCILVFVSVIREKDKPTILASGKSVICN